MEVKYDKIGIGYNQTRKADKYLTEQLLFYLNPNAKGLYLDLGCGTGNYTNELQKSGFQLIGMDPSGEMLKIAKSLNQKLDWRIGSAENTTLPDNYIDGIICFLTIHHWENLDKGFSELSRIMKNQGSIVIFTSTPRQMKGYWLNYYFPKMLNDSISQMPSLQDLKDAMKKAGIEVTGIKTYSIKSDLEDCFLYCGKLNPELYFDPKIRNGISSFSSLADREEIEKGLSDLRKDINSGKINKIIKSYENDLGDYMFIIGQKTGGNNV